MDEDYDYILATYQVPARTGRRVRYTGGNAPRMGTIVGSFGNYLGIRLDGEKEIGRYHPTWALEYLDENEHIIVRFEAS